VPPKPAQPRSILPWLTFSAALLAAGVLVALDAPAGGTYLLSGAGRALVIIGAGVIIALGSAGLAA
jgi:hypothetical protein